MPNYLAVFQSGGITEIEKRYVAKEIMLLGDKTAEYGIVLSEKDCTDIAECRFESLKENERIEVGLGAVQRIIEEFCDSGYVSQINFRETVEGLLECFYMIKSETFDKVSDDEVLEFLRDGKISAGHARAILGLKDEEKMLSVAERVVEKELSVRDVERTVRLLNYEPAAIEEEDDA